MTRHVERLEGLLILGSGRVGPLTVPTPEVLEADPGAPNGGRTPLTSLPSHPGIRRLRIGGDAGSLELEIPVLAPEVLGPPAGPLSIGTEAVLVHGPLSEGGPDRPGRLGLIVLGNAHALWADGAPFIEAIRQVRERWGAAPLLWAPRVALPHRVAFLAYIGVDLLDSTEGYLAASRGEYLDMSLGSLDAAPTSLDDPADAGAVASVVGNVERTRQEYDRALGETRRAARAGRLRELVESRLPTEPALAEMLRYADRELSGLLDERTPVTGGPVHAYSLAESQRRPEMGRFRRRLLQRYRPPASKTVLLLVPCSKTKPYRMSRSHRRFATALADLRAAERVHVVSVSSPIGLVPRELEDVPPACHYDIPVTGDWTEVEREAVVAGFTHLLATGPYRSAVVHLDPAEYGFVRPAFPDGFPVRWTVADGRPTSGASISALRSGLLECLVDQSPVPGGPLAVVREELREVAAVQFGRPAAERLFGGPVRLAGRPWFQRITDGRTELATLREERGLLFLTVAGAERLADEPPLAVDVDPSLPLTGDLFVPGVRAADAAIRIGDSVILRRDGRLAGVGEAALPGRLMTDLDHGVAVRVRHRVGHPTDTAKTAEDPARAAGPVV